MPKRRLVIPKGRYQLPNGPVIPPELPIKPPVIQPKQPIKPGPIIPPGPAIPPIPGTISVSVLRARDMLLLDFKFVNFEYVRDPKKTITSLQAIQNQPAYIIVSFPPQSIMEQAYLEQDPNVQVLSDPQTLPIKSRISGPSQLVFQLPEARPADPDPDHDRVFFLNILSTFPLKVAPAALPSLNQNSTMDDGENQSPEIRQPGPMETSIEVPFRLIISPNRYAAWVHALKEVMASQTPASPQKEVHRVELWHTRRLPDRLQEKYRRGRIHFAPSVPSGRRIAASVQMQQNVRIRTTSVVTLMTRFAVPWMPTTVLISSIFLPITSYFQAIS